MQIPHEKSLPLQVVSLSLGIATSDVTALISYEELIKRADTALYMAKEKGRNRIEVFTENV